MTENTPVADVDEALVEEVARVLESATPASIQLARRASRAVLAHLAATGQLVGEGEERVEYDTVRCGYMGGDGNVHEEVDHFSRTVRTWTTPDGATGTLVGPWVEVQP